MTVADQAALDAFAGLDAAEIFITSSAALVKGDEDAAEITVASGEKCERCWVVKPEVVSHGELCNRCDEAVSAHDAA